MMNQAYPKSYIFLTKKPTSLFIPYLCCFNQSYGTLHFMDEKINISILFVEDEKVLRIIYQKILSKYVDVLYLAEDGVEGLKLYHEHKPDLIVSDIQLPRLNGLEMIEKIREDDEDTKIIIVSAYSEASYFIDAIKLQVNGFLLKPVDRESLIQQVKNIAKAIITFVERNR